MAHKFWRLTLKGQPSIDDIHSAVGASGAIVVRLHFEAGQTQVYVAADEAARDHVVKAIKASGPAEEVSHSDATKLA
jgi:hypothetical protein